MSGQEVPPLNQARVDHDQAPKECVTCRVIGTGALAAVGIYALQASRPHAPGSVIGKRITAGVGVCFLVASVFRWQK